MSLQPFADESVGDVTVCHSPALSTHPDSREGGSSGDEETGMGGPGRLEEAMDKHKG